jgi:hypothetical protein
VTTRGDAAGSATTPVELFDWLNRVVLADATAPPTQSFEIVVVVANAPSLKPAKARTPPVFFGVGRRAIVVVPCGSSSGSNSPEELLKGLATVVDRVLSSDRAEDGDVVTASRYHLSLSFLDAAPLERVLNENTEGMMRERKEEGGGGDDVENVDSDSQNADPHGRDPCAGKISLGWSGKRAAASLRPFLSKIAAVVPTSVDSQVVRFGRISNRVRQSHASNIDALFSYVTPQDLQSVRSLLGDGFNLQSGMVSSLKAPLHLLLYAPPKRDQPLFVVSSPSPSAPLSEKSDGPLDESAAQHRGLGFSVPRFGGVVIWNSHFNSTTTTTTTTTPSTLCELGADDLRVTSDLWVSQLRQLIGLGIDNRTSSEDDNVIVLRSPEGVTEWELDGLARSRFRYFIGRTVSALSALSKLSLDMPHMAVGKTVSRHVEVALAELQLAEEVLAPGRGGVTVALRHASRAFEHAQLAESDPSMAPLRYFPPEHLAAVYLPLIVPLIVPMLAGIKKGYTEVHNGRT